MAIAAEAHFSCRHGMVHTLFLPACKSIHTCTSIHIQHTAAAPMRARPEDRRRAVKAEDGGEARRGEAEEMCGLHSLRCLPCPPACLPASCRLGKLGKKAETRRRGVSVRDLRSVPLPHSLTHTLISPCLALPRRPASSVSFLPATPHFLEDIQHVTRLLCGSRQSGRNPEAKAR